MRIFLCLYLTLYFAQINARLWQQTVEETSRAVLEMALEWNVASIQVLVCEQSPASERRFATSLIKSLTKGIEKDGVHKRIGVVALTFHQFIEVRKRSVKFGTWENPLQIIVGSETAKEDLLRLSKSHSLEFAKSRWMVILPEDQSEEEFFKDVEIPFDAQLVSAKWSSGKLNLRDVYRVLPKHPLITHDLGTWDTTGGLKILNEVMYSWRSDLQGITLRTGSIENWPVSTIKEIEGKKNVEIDGFFPRVWQNLEEVMNFSTISYRSIDNTTGSNNTNGNWSGLIGMLRRNEIDVIVSELNMNEERIQVMDFTHPLLNTRYQIYFKLRGYDVSWTAMFRPFHFSTWLALAAWLFVAAWVLTFCFQLSTSFEPEMEMPRNYLTAFLFMVQSICQQGCNEVPKSAAIRIIFLLAYLLSAIIIPSYSASLISSLTAQMPSRPFNSLSEMLKYGDYKLMVGKNTAEYSLFENAKDELYARVFRELVLPVETIDQTDGMSLLCKKSQEYARFGVESTLDIKAERINSPECEITKLSQPLSVVYQSIGMAKDSAFTGLIHYHIGKMFTSGAIDRIQRSVWPLPAKRHNTDFKQVQPQQVFQIFVFLLATMIFSLILLIGEMRSFHRKKRELRNLQRKTDQPHFRNTPTSILIWE